MSYNNIQWLPAKREKRTKDCHSISNGVKCSRCGCFQELPSRFCKDCGGHFDGELVKVTTFERSFKKWHE